jgi:hypothetical protein
MKNITITELTGSDIHFDQDIDTDTVIASSGGVAVNGDMKDSAVNTGINTGIVAGDDVTLDDSILGNNNVQVNDSDIDAFALGGDATSAHGENVNLGSGKIFDVDAGEDATIVTGNGNEVTGDVDVDVDHADGPVNVAVGDDNKQQAVEDESYTIEGSYNTDASTEDSYNTLTQSETDLRYEDNDTYESSVDDSFNSRYEDNDTTTTELEFSSEDSSSYSDNDTWHQELELEMHELAVFGEGNDVELDA